MRSPRAKNTFQNFKNHKPCCNQFHLHRASPACTIQTVYKRWTLPLLPVGSEDAKLAFWSESCYFLGGLLSPGGSNFSVSPRVLHMDVISNFGTQKKIDCFINICYFSSILFIRCLNWVIFSFMKNKNKLLEEHLESGILESTHAFTNLQKHYI